MSNTPNSTPAEIPTTIPLAEFKDWPDKPFDCPRLQSGENVLVEIGKIISGFRIAVVNCYNLTKATEFGELLCEHPTRRGTDSMCPVDRAVRSHPKLDHLAWFNMPGGDLFAGDMED